MMRTLELESGSLGSRLECSCERCGHAWITRKGEPPTICPKCKSPYWDRARKQKNRTKEVR